MPQRLEKSAISPSGRMATTATVFSCSSGKRADKPDRMSAELAFTSPSTHWGIGMSHAVPFAFPPAQTKTTFSSEPSWAIEVIIAAKGSRSTSSL